MKNKIKTKLDTTFSQLPKIKKGVSKGWQGKDSMEGRDSRTIHMD
jgi:hypothetical protein